MPYAVGRGKRCEKPGTLGRKVRALERQVAEQGEIIKKQGEIIEELDKALGDTQQLLSRDAEEQEETNRTFRLELDQLDGELHTWFGLTGIIGWIFPYIHSLKNILGYIEPPQVEEHQGDDNV
jgi:hypothetical protein